MTQEFDGIQIARFIEPAAGQALAFETPGGAVIGISEDSPWLDELTALQDEWLANQPGGAL